MNLKRWGYGIAAAAALVLSVGCSTSTTMTNVWKDPEYKGAGFSRIMIMGVIKETGVRRSFEDAFVQRLTEAGVSAVASYRYLPIEGGKPEKEAIVAATGEAGADGLVVTSLVNVDKDSVYYPPTRGVGGYYGYYNRAWGAAYSPGYYATYTTVRLQTNLYDVSADKLVWSGQSETFDPNSAKEVIDTLVPKVIADLKESGLI